MSDVPEDIRRTAVDLVNSSGAERVAFAVMASPLGLAIICKAILTERSRLTPPDLADGTKAGSDILGMFLDEDERLAYHSAMDQWERSLKRTDLSEKDRVRGALFAFSRQTLACSSRAQPNPSED